MKNLILLFHPNLDKSIYNRNITAKLQEEGLDLEVRNIYALYPDFKIDVAKEQAKLLKFDRIIFQFPQYWYSTPALLKEWMDVVLEYGFAYGTGGFKLKGKYFLISTTLGMNALDPAFAYLEQIWIPFKLSADFCQMIYESPIFTYNLEHHLDQSTQHAKINEHVEKLKKALS